MFLSRDRQLLAGIGDKQSRREDKMKRGVLDVPGGMD